MPAAKNGGRRDAGGAGEMPLTPSGLARFSACTASELLDHAQVITSWSRRGNVVHAFFQATSNLGRAKALAQTKPEFRGACASIDLDRLPPLDKAACAVEVAFALNWRTGVCRELGRGLSREEAARACGPDEMPGIADYVALTPDEVVVVDWKSGWGEVDAAEVNLQTGTYGLMAARTYERDRARVVIIRVLDNGSIYFDVAVFDSLDLEAIEARVRILQERLTAARQLFAEKGLMPRPVLGDHCRYCPALRFCPAQFGALLELVADATGQPPAMVREATPITVEAAASVWPKLQAAKKLIEALEATVENFARQQPVPLANGKVLAEVPASKETIDPDKAAPALAAKYGKGFVDTAVEVKKSITKERLSDTLRDQVQAFLPPGKNGKQPPFAPIEREALALIRDAGAMNTASYLTVREVAPEKLPDELKPKLDPGPPQLPQEGAAA